MKEDFLQTFKDYSTVALLKILATPEKYQPEAVEAANEILADHDVTDTHKQEVQVYIEHLKLKKHQKTEKTGSVKRYVSELFRPLLSNGEDPTPSNWLNSFLILIGIQIIWILFETIHSIITINDSFLINLNIVILIYACLLFYLLFKRKKWGWILLFAEKLITVLMIVFMLIAFLIYPFGEVYLRDVFWPLIISVFFLYYLWRQEIIEFFNINNTEKKQLAKRIAYVVVFLGVLILVMHILNKMIKHSNEISSTYKDKVHF